ncbi:MAG: HNH endonuclease [Marinovum sp.]|nr:HNH endonuclease [Marinovum sp.]
MIICEFCNRPIPINAPQSVHHLIPRSKGGKKGPTVILHHLCHKEIHITLSEAELARTYNNLKALREHPRLSKFISWVKKRPPEFLSRSRGRKKK